MLKLAGCLCVLFACTMYGFHRSIQYSRRPRQIRQLIQSLGRLETEIVYGFTPLPAALRAAANACREPLSSMLLQAAALMSGPDGRPAAMCWREAVVRWWPNTSMKEAEKETMLQLGGTLGITGKDSQVKHIRLALSQLQAEENAAADEQRRYETMWKSLGVLAGALLVILMV